MALLAPDWDVDRFYDMRFSAEEATRWERLVAEGVSRDEATQIVRDERAILPDAMASKSSAEGR